MEIWKWLLLILVAIAGFLLLSRPAPVIKEGQQTRVDEARSVELIEQGSFIIAIQTIKIGEESFSFTRNGNAYVLTSEVSLELFNQNFQFSQLTELSEDLEVQKYVLTALLPQGNQTSTTIFQNNLAKIGLEAEGQIETYEKEGQPPWFVADSNIGSHYYILYHLIRTREAEGFAELSGTVIVPQTLETFHIALTSIDKAMLRTLSKEIAVTRYAFTLGDFEFALYGNDDVFYVAELITQQTIAYRSDLVTEQPEIIYQP